MNISPRIVSAVRSAYESAVTEVARGEAALARVESALSMCSLVSKLAAQKASLDLSESDKEAFTRLVDQNNQVVDDALDAKNQIEEQLKDLREQLIEIEADLKEVDPTYGADLGPELPLPQ